MTLELELPDDVAQTLLALPEPERSRRVADALRHDIPLPASFIEDAPRVPGEPVPSANGHYRIMDFYGIGKDRPGAVGDDVEGYLYTLRSE